MSESTAAMIPDPVNKLMAVYKEKFSTVVFPDISLEILENLVLEAEEVQKNLDEAKKQVEKAQKALEENTETLLNKCVRGLAYAKIYAEGDEDLTKVLSGINLGKAVRTPRRASSREKAKPVVSKPKDEISEEKKADENV